MATVGVATVSGIAGCAEFTGEGDTQEPEPEPEPEPESEPDPEPEPESNTTPEEGQTPTQEESLTDDEIAHLIEAYQIALTRSGFILDRVERDNEYLVVGYQPSVSERITVLSERLQIAQIVYREVLQQGFVPEYLQIWLVEGDFVDIRSEWIVRWIRGEIPNGQLLVFTESDNPDTLESDELAIEAFRLETIRSGREVNEHSFTGDGIVNVEYHPISDERSLFDEILGMANIFLSELVAQDIAVDSLEATIEDQTQYTIHSEWVDQWGKGEITDAGLLAYVERTIEE